MFDFTNRQSEIKKYCEQDVKVTKDLYEFGRQNRQLFYKSFTSPWFTEINPMAIEYAFLFYFTVAKWQAVLFYLNLLREYDNKYGERDRFISEMKQIYAKWKSVIVALSSATN